MTPYSNKETEYWYNVSSQKEMPIAGETKGDFNITRLAQFIKSVISDPDGDIRSRVVQLLENEPQLFTDIRQLLGITDKRAYLELSFIASRIKHPTKNTGICGCYPCTMARHPLSFFMRMLGGSQGSDVKHLTAQMMADFLILSGLKRAVEGYGGMNQDALECIYESLILPRELQQREAKRRGHGCESALAQAIVSCGVSILPEEKATSPMGKKDPHLSRQTLELVEKKIKGETFGFDMIVLDRVDPRVAIQSLIHTSDPGQYGVSKSDETVEIADQFKKVKESGKRTIELWGLLDGIGFSENKKDTLNKMLHHFDSFIQLKTLYKAPLRLHEIGLCSIKAIQFCSEYTGDDVENIIELYVSDNIRVLREGDSAPTGSRGFVAGRATIFV